MKTFRKTIRIPAPVEEVFDWHNRPGAIERLSPPWDPIRLIKRTGGLEPGTEVELELSAFGPFSMKWKALHTECIANELFRDVQEKGPFSSWVHTHRFSPDGPENCLLEDEVEYALPLHPATTAMMGGLVNDRLHRIFAYRHDTTSADILDHQKSRLEPMNILVTGSHGVIGSALIPFLTTGGHQVVRMVRKRSQSGTDTRFWSPATGEIEFSPDDRFDAVIHLAGENIGQGPWDDKKKKSIIESRTRSTALLAETLAEMQHPPRVLISASAIGYYGDRGDQVLTETDDPGMDFISGVCRAWENAAAPAVKTGIRTVFTRIGVVLTPRGGALQRLLPIFRLGLGGRLGNGRQYMSWIGIDDVLGAILYALADNTIEGPLNLVSPNPVTNGELSRTLGKVLFRPSAVRVPEFAINMAFGQMGRETVLSSTRVHPEKLVKKGFRFRHQSLAPALEHLLGRKNKP